MSKSLIFGVARVRTSHWLVDRPGGYAVDSTSTTIVRWRMRFAWRNIAAPCWQGRRGHPVGFSQALGRNFAALSGDEVAKILIQTYLEQLHIIDCDDSGHTSGYRQADDLNFPKKFRNHHDLEYSRLLSWNCANNAVPMR